MNYTKLLKDYNLKVTPQRIAIVDELHKHGHMNIDALYKELLFKFPSISLATIYKNINSMIEKVFVDEVKIDNKKSVFELSKKNHAHIICSVCGSIEDMDFELKDLVKEVSKSTKFEIEKTSLCFTGKCKDCS